MAHPPHNPNKRNPADPHDHQGRSDHAGEHEITDPLAQAEERIAHLEAEVQEANLRALRAVADHQNFVKRSIQNEQVARQRGIATVVQNIVNVLDHFDLALNHDLSNATAQQVVEGLKVIRDDLIQSLQMPGTTVIQPQPNDEFKPGVHEAIMQQSADGVEPGHVAATFQPGYQLGEFVIRAAKVAVAPPA